MSFTRLSQKKEPNPALVQLVKKMNGHSFRALDVGAGPLAESIFLLERGFHVDAIDKDPESALRAKSIIDEKFTFTRVDIKNHDLPCDSYDLAISFLALPFIKREDFFSVFHKLVGAIKQDGYFLLSLFGERDDWAKNSEKHMTFFSREEVKNLFEGLFEIERFIEEDKTAPSVAGEIKLWHIFTVVARKK